MITEKTIYHSSITHTDYPTHDQATKAEHDTIHDVSVRAEMIRELVDQFHTLRTEYNEQVSKLQTSYQHKMDAIVDILVGMGVTDLQVPDDVCKSCKAKRVTAHKVDKSSKQ